MDANHNQPEKTKSLNTNVIKLASLEYRDLPKLYEWINNEDLVLFNSYYKPVSEMEHKDWFESISKKSDLFIFTIRLEETDNLIGTCQLQRINFIDSNAELQIRIGESKGRGKGYGTQAVRHLLDFAFRQLNLHRVYLHVFKDNVGAIKSYEKVGFVKEGLLRDAAHVNGKYVDSYVMGVLRNEYS